MALSDDFNSEPSLPDDCPDLPHLYEHAAARLLRRLHECGELSSAQASTTVLSALPSELSHWLGRRLKALGWLRDEARVSFDVFDSPERPAELTGWRREFARLVVFGVPGEGLKFDAKRREAVFQQRCGEILREVRDLESLSYAAARALGHPEVHGDPILVGMLRVFISEREAELHSRSHLPDEADTAEANEARAAAARAPVKAPLRQRVHLALTKLEQEFARHAAAYVVGGAEEAVKRIEDLRRRYPAHVDDKIVERCREQLAVLTQHREEFRDRLSDLVTHGVEAMRQSDQKTAAWVRRRLDAIHASLPAVLPMGRLKSLKAVLDECVERQERHEVARRLVSREQAVGAKIKTLGKAIHGYRRALEAPPDDRKALRRWAEEYDQACKGLRALDDEWLADLMIELDCLLVDLRGSRESQRRAAAQVDKFVEDVRGMLRKLRKEVRKIEKQRAGTGADRRDSAS